MVTARRRTARKPKEPARVVVDGLPFDPASKDLPPGLRRFGAQLDKARVALATTVAPDAKGPDALLGHVLYRANLRTPLFMLEGLSRIARDTSEDEETFRAVLRDVKIAEDVLGLVDFWWVLHGKGQEWELPEEFLQMARDRHQAASGRLVGWLEARAWIDHRYLPEEGEVQLRVHRIGRDLKDLNWPSARKERKRLLAFFRECVEATERAAQSLDLNDVEHGIHELRRRLRWISIYANALDGAVQLDKSAKAPKNWSRYLTPAVVENPFNDLPKGDGKGADPILFPAPLFYALSWLIAELGTLKDRAQWTESVAHGLEALGVAGGGKPKRWLGEVALDAKEAGKAAGALSRQALLEDKLLQRLAAALEAQS
jgi:hypothetical protein